VGDVRVVALEGITLDVRAGEALAITGPSGSGKSTLLNLIGGLDRPTSGTVLVDGRDLGQLGSRELAAYRATTVGFVFQSFRLLPYLGALENVALPLMLVGRERGAAGSRARELLDRVGLATRATHRPGQLSGGEQQRVAVARAIANAPKLLLADEPTGNLDAAASVDLLDLFDVLRADGLTLLVATHNAEVTRRMDRVVALRAGAIATTATS